MQAIDISQETQSAQLYDYLERIHLTCAITNQPLLEPVLLGTHVCERSAVNGLMRRDPEQFNGYFLQNDQFTMRLLQFLLENINETEFYISPIDTASEDLTNAERQLYALFEDPATQTTDLNARLYCNITDGTYCNPAVSNNSQVQDFLANGNARNNAEIINQFFEHPLANQLRKAILLARKNNRQLNLLTVFKPQKNVVLPLAASKAKTLWRSQKEGAMVLSVIVAIGQFFIYSWMLVPLIGGVTAGFLVPLALALLSINNTYSLISRLKQRVDNNAFMRLSSSRWHRRLAFGVSVLGMTLVVNLFAGLSPSFWLTVVVFSVAICLHQPLMSIREAIFNLTSRALHNTKNTFKALFTANSNYHAHQSKWMFRIVVEGGLVLLTSAVIFTGLAALTAVSSYMLCTSLVAAGFTIFDLAIPVMAITAVLVPRMMMLGIVASQKLSRLITGSQPPFAQLEVTPPRSTTEKVINVLGRLSAIVSTLAIAAVDSIKGFSLLGVISITAGFIFKFFAQDVAKIEVNSSQLAVLPEIETISTYNTIKELFTEQHLRNTEQLPQLIRAVDANAAVRAAAPPPSYGDLAGGKYFLAPPAPPAYQQAVDAASLSNNGAGGGPSAL